MLSRGGPGTVCRSAEARIVVPRPTRQSLNKVIDYMLSGKPVLASFTGYPSMINEAECGSYVPAEDVDALSAEIERYASMPVEDRERLGKRGRDWLLKNRKFETLAQDYLRLMNLPARDAS